MIWFSALRVRQWSKNLLVFVPLIFARRLEDTSLYLPLLFLFAVFCILSSAAYLGNDVRDAEVDKNHPLKRDRPIASGQIKKESALAAGAILLTTGMVVSGFFFSISVSLLLAAYVILQVFYILFLRSLALADIISIALGFVVRAVAGALVIEVAFSVWLVLCVFFGAARIALGKRQAELAIARSGLRKGWEKVSNDELRMLGGMTSAVLLLIYTFYSFSSATALATENVADAFAISPLIITLPIVYFALMRYELLAVRGETGEPELLLLRDTQLSGAFVLWLLISVAALYLLGA